MTPDYQVALVTGAGSGIGRALSLALAREGTAVAAVDIQEDGLHSLAEELTQAKLRCVWGLADVTDAAALRDRCQDLERQLGPVDLLIANAGVGIETSALKYNAEGIAKIIAVNLTGVSNSIGAVLPGMLERRRGHVAAISSVASFRGMPGMLGYCASKSGVNALMEGLRVEVRGHGIATTIICPGWIRTPLTAQINVRLSGILEPGVAARHILGAIHKRKKFYAFPFKMVWQLRLLRWLPTEWADRMLERFFQNQTTEEKNRMDEGMKERAFMLRPLAFDVVEFLVPIFLGGALFFLGRYYGRMRLLRCDLGQSHSAASSPSRRRVRHLALPPAFKNSSSSRAMHW